MVNSNRQRQESAASGPLSDLSGSEGMAVEPEVNKSPEREVQHTPSHDEINREVESGWKAGVSS